MNIAYKCRVCKKPGITKCADDCPADWLAKLSPMLTCDACYDKRTMLVAALEAIGRLCSTRARMHLLRLDADAAQKQTESIRKSLWVATRNYASVVAKIENLAQPLWSEDFPEQLMDHPQKVQMILQHYRRGLRANIGAPVERNLPYADVVFHVAGNVGFKKTIEKDEEPKSIRL